MGHKQRMRLLNEQEMLRQVQLKRGDAEAAKRDLKGDAGATRRDERPAKGSSSKPSASKHANARERDAIDAPRGPPAVAARAPPSETESTLSERPPPPAASLKPAGSSSSKGASGAAATSHGAAAGKKRGTEKQQRPVHVQSELEMPVVEPLRLSLDSDATHTARTIETAREPSSRKSAHSHSRSTIPEHASTAREERASRSEAVSGAASTVSSLPPLKHRPHPPSGPSTARGAQSSAAASVSTAADGPDAINQNQAETARTERLQSESLQVDVASRSAGSMSKVPSSPGVSPAHQHHSKAARLRRLTRRLNDSTASNASGGGGALASPRAADTSWIDSAGQLPKPSSSTARAIARGASSSSRPKRPERSASPASDRKRDSSHRRSDSEESHTGILYIRTRFCNFNTQYHTSSVYA